MKKPILAVALLIGFGDCPVRSFAETSTNATLNVDEVISESAKVIEAEGWTAQDVADAIRSLRGLYLRDNATKVGRIRWHGNVVKTVVTTNGTTILKTTTHEDGETFTVKGKVRSTAKSVKAANARLQRPVMTNGVPAKLAAARLRRQAEVAQGVSNVTVTVTAGGK